MKQTPGQPRGVPVCDTRTNCADLQIEKSWKKLGQFCENSIWHSRGHGAQSAPVDLFGLRARSKALASGSGLQWVVRGIGLRYLEGPAVVG